MRFIHIADVHLGVRPDSKFWWAREREKEIFASFFECLLIAKKEAVDCIFISGDLFHFPPTYEQLEAINAQFKKLSPIKIVYIGGEHDFVEENSALSYFSFAPNVIFLSAPKKQFCYIEELNTWVYGISYDRREICMPIYDAITPDCEEEGIHILLAHGGDRKHSPMDFEKLKWSGFDYIALGHIHKQRTLVEDLMAYPGSLEPLDKTEEGKHGFLFGEITEEKRIVHFIPHAKREYITVRIKLSSEMTRIQISDKLKETILSLGENNIYTIILEGCSEKDLDFTYFELKDTYRILDILDNTKKYEPLEALYEKNKDNVLGALVLQSRQEEISKLDRDAIECAIDALLYSVK